MAAAVTTVSMASENSNRSIESVSTSLPFGMTLKTAPRSAGTTSTGPVWGGAEASPPPPLHAPKPTLTANAALTPKVAFIQHSLENLHWSKDRTSCH
jgi:hypothetical protein